MTDSERLIRIDERVGVIQGLLKEHAEHHAAFEEECDKRHASIARKDAAQSAVKGVWLVIGKTFIAMLGGIAAILLQRIVQ